MSKTRLQHHKKTHVKREARSSPRRMNVAMTIVVTCFFLWTTTSYDDNEKNIDKQKHCLTYDPFVTVISKASVRASPAQLLHRLQRKMTCAISNTRANLPAFCHRLVAMTHLEVFLSRQCFRCSNSGRLIRIHL